MSTSEKLELENLDTKVKDLEKRLPWHKRFIRRYFNARMVVTGQVFEAYGFGKGWIAFGGWPKFTAWFALKFPAAALVAEVAWDHVTTVVEAAFAVASHR